MTAHESESAEYYVKIEGNDIGVMASKVDIRRHRFPHCIVWTPIPMITWFLPFVGHMGIATTSGVIRDFAGSYYVSEDDMAFGWPTRYYQCSLSAVSGADAAWDSAVRDASDEYKQHFHNLCCDNCHSHVALALNTMAYNESTACNMLYLTALMFVRGKYTGTYGVFCTWMPFLVIVTIAVIVCVLLPVYLG